jgi:uncharacterized damage-inducible protein DinB/GNAT superfamily N-acetyltransferase
MPQVRTVHAIEIRPLAARHSFDAITRLLHQAYGPMAVAGMNFTAATQTAEVTARRAAEGQCFVAEHGGEIVGTVTVCGPYAEGEAPWAAGISWFRDRDTAHFHQFAVHPKFQGQGLGQRLIAACESWALQRGYRRMALDTPEPAADLRALYARLGYADVERIQWEGKTYGSVVMQKALDRSPLREQLQTLARYNLWATRRLCEHVDALPDGDYRRDAGLFFKSVHGTLNHLLVAEHQLWFRRFAEGASPSVVLNAEIEPDRARLRERLVDGALAWLPLLGVWPESRLQGTLEYRRINGQRVALPFAATLAHVFNHATHHRGQVTAALTAMGRPCPELDMVVMLQQESPLP